MVRFFKKSVPDTPIRLASGRSVKFSTLDNVTGYFATENEQVQNELVGFITQMRYGLSEIGYEEYQQQFVELKKNSPAGILRKPWREEVAPNRIVMDTSSSNRTPAKPSPSVNVAVGGEPSDIRRNGANVSELSAEAAAKLPTAKKEEAPSPFEPPVGKRAKTSPE